LIGLVNFISPYALSICSMFMFNLSTWR
jgi:hypothetical protein